MEQLVTHKISIVFGGTSAERDLSLRTFHNVYTELQKRPVDNALYHYVYYINEDGLVVKKPFNFEKDPDYYLTTRGKVLSILDAMKEVQGNDDYLFSLLYGLFGEDGHFQGIGKTLNIKSSFGSVLSCSLSKSKFHCAKYVESMYPELEPIPTISIREEHQNYLAEKLFSFNNQEIVVKPNSLGTSMLAERFVLNKNSLPRIANLIKHIFSYDDTALVQQYIQGEEFSCGCIENLDAIEALPLMLVRTQDCFFGRREKLSKIGVSERIVPVDYNACTLKIANLSERLFADLQFENMCRFDFIASEGKIYFLEANSLPGLSTISCFPKMLQEVNVGIPDFIQLTYKNSLHRRNKQSSIN